MQKSEPLVKIYFTIVMKYPDFNFYLDVERIKRLNETLSDDLFFIERGYFDLNCVPSEIKKLSFPVFSPLLFLHRNPQNVLDIGCGAGLDMFILKNRLPDSFVAGVDISFPLLKENKRHADAIVLNADGSVLPFKNRVFDLVIMNGFLNLVIDKKFFLAEVGRVLKSNGYIFVADIFRKKDVEIPQEGYSLNLKESLKLKELFGIFTSFGFAYEKGRFDAGYTREFGLFGILWRKV